MNIRLYTGFPLLRVSHNRLSKYILDTCKYLSASMILLNKKAVVLNEKITK